MKSKRAIFLRKFGKITGYMLLFCLFSLFTYWVFIWMFTIKNIVVVSNSIHISVDQSKLPKTIILFPSSTIRTQLLAENPILADIQFQKKYPHTLVIVPTLRTPVIRLSAQSREVLVDATGIVTRDAGLGDRVLPQLVLPIPAVRTGETLHDPRVTNSILFLQETKDILPVTTISVEDTQSLRAKSPALDILFPQNGDIHATLATLQTLLAGFRIKGTLPTFIDLRFNKPIIKF